MRRISTFTIVGLFAFSLASAQAQYTANFQTNIISGVISNWSGNYVVGSNTFADVLLIQNSGVLSNEAGYIGFDISSSNNSVVITDAGSVWHNSGTFSMAYNNTLLITSGGRVNSAGGAIGNITGDCNNNVLVSGSGSVWNASSGGYFLDIGTLGSGNNLVISNGGQVISGAAGIGYLANSRNNRVLVTGARSIWTNDSPFIIGTLGSSNSLVIEHGAQVVSVGPGGSFVGDSSSGNSALVTGSGSVWSNGSTLRIGDKNLSAGNRLVISNGGQVVSGNGYIGSVFGSTGGQGSNSVEITGNASLWKVRGRSAFPKEGILFVGSSSPGNSLTIKDNGEVLADKAVYVGRDDLNFYSGSGNRVSVLEGELRTVIFSIGGNLGSSNSLIVAGGSVFATNVMIGFSSSTCDNWIQLDDGSLTVTNASHDAVLEVRNGKFIMNGSTLRVDRFVMTNACAHFVRTGGTLIYGTAVLDPNASAIGDGIPNGWKQQYGLDPFDPNVASTDSDGDGFSNLQEYLAGTDPTNSAAAFRILSILRTNNAVQATWQTGTGKTNALQRIGNLSGSFADIFIVTNTTGSVTNFLDVGGATNPPPQFYRVRLVP